MWTASQSKEQTSDSQQENGAQNYSHKALDSTNNQKEPESKLFPEECRKVQPGQHLGFVLSHETLSRGSSLSYADSQLTETVI